MDKYQKLYENLNRIIYFIKTEKFDVISRKELFTKDIEQSREKIKELEKQKEELNHIYEVLVNYDKILKENLKNNIKSIVLPLLGVAAAVGLMQFGFGMLSLKGVLNIALNYLVITIGGIGIYHYSETRNVRKIYKNNINRIDDIPNMITELDEMIEEVYKLISFSENTLEVLAENEQKLDADLVEAKKYSDILLDKIQVIIENNNAVEQINEAYENDNSITDIVRLVREKTPKDCSNN